MLSLPLPCLLLLLHCAVSSVLLISVTFPHYCPACWLPNASSSPFAHVDLRLTRRSFCIAFIIRGLRCDKQHITVRRHLSVHLCTMGYGEDGKVQNTRGNPTNFDWYNVYVIKIMSKSNFKISLLSLNQTYTSYRFWMQWLDAMTGQTEVRKTQSGPWVSDATQLNHYIVTVA